MSATVPTGLDLETLELTLESIDEFAQRELPDSVALEERAEFPELVRRTGPPMGVGLEDVLAVKALEAGVVPPVPNFRDPDPDPELGILNLSPAWLRRVRLEGYRTTELPGGVDADAPAPIRAAMGG